MESHVKRALLWFCTNINIQSIDTYCYCHTIHTWHYRCLTYEGTKVKCISLPSKIVREKIYDFPDNASIICIGKYLYVFGGKQSRSACIIDLESLKQKSLPHMAHKKMYMALCYSDSCIYHIGGVKESIGICECNKYNIMKKKWEEVPNLKAPRYNASCGRIGRNLYAIGGENKLGIVYVFEKLALDCEKFGWNVMAVEVCPLLSLSVPMSCIGYGKCMIVFSNKSRFAVDIDSLSISKLLLKKRESIGKDEDGECINPRRSGSAYSNYKIILSSMDKIVIRRYLSIDTYKLII